MLSEVKPREIPEPIMISKVIKPRAIPKNLNSVTIQSLEE
jgi:hypothetical protein